MVNVLAHILPCVIEAELFGVAVWVIAHARDVVALVVVWMKYAARGGLS